MMIETPERLEAALQKLEYWFDTDQEILDALELILKQGEKHE